MIIKVLGSSGSLTSKDKTTCFLIDEHILLDAGSAASMLSLEEQFKLKHIFISHTHFDHIKDLPLLADNLSSMDQSLNVYGTENVLRQIRLHLFNDAIWPDFTSIPSQEEPFVRMQEIFPGDTFQLDNLSFKPFVVNHTVETVGYIVQNEHAGFIYTGDTGYTKTVVEEANEIENLKAIFIETSFPNSKRELANASKHLTPEILQDMLQGLRNKEIPIYIFHIKPQFFTEVSENLNKINELNIEILEQKKTFEF